MKSIIALLFCAVLFGVSGCASLPAYNASEVHQTTSYPLIFASQVDATGVEKVTQPDGKVVRKAKTLTITVTAGGFAQTTVLKDAEVDATK